MREAGFALRENVQPDEFRRRLQEALPEGIEIVGARLAAESDRWQTPCLSENELIVVGADPLCLP